MKWPDPPIVNDFLLSNIVSLKVGGLVSLLCINFSFVGFVLKKIKIVVKSATTEIM